MIPRLYDSDETEFKTLGLGELAQSESCTVTEGLNGELELEMVYPVDGDLFAELADDRWILAKPNPTAKPQPFFIYDMKDSMDGMNVTVYARHACYLGNTIPVSPFSASGAQNALDGLNSHAMVTSPFSFSTDINGAGSTYKLTKPTYLKACLGGSDGSVVDIFGGELEYDGFNIILHKRRGADNGVVIEYGKNLRTLEQERSIEETYTGATAFWQNTSGDEIVTVQGKVVKGSSTGRDKILLLDASSEFKEQPTEDQLTQYAENYYNDNNIGVPKVTLDVSFAALWQSEEYKTVTDLEAVSLGDTVTVKFLKLGVSASARVIKTEYDVLLNRYSSIEIGDARSTLSDTVKQAVSPAINDEIKASQTFLQQAIAYATALITGNKGGHFLWLYDDDGKPTDLLIMDTDDVSTAKKLWRWNASGLGHSDNGIDGPYTTAWTMDGQFNADYIAGKTLQGVTVKAGSFSGGSISIGSGFYVDSSGNMTCNDADIRGNISGNITSSGLDCSDGYIQATELKDSGGKTMLSTKSDGITVYAWYGGKQASVIESGVKNGNTPCVVVQNTQGGGLPVVSDGTSHAFTLDWDGDSLVIYVEGSKQITIDAGTYTKQSTPKLRPLYRLYNSTTGDHMISNSSSESGYTSDGIYGYVLDSNSWE